jgi:hypothetical protein
MKKRKKKNNNNNSWLFILSRLFRRALFFLSFFPSDVSTLAFLHFFNPRNEERFRQSLSLDTRMQSIQSTVVVEVRFKFSLSFKLSFKTLFFYLFRRKRFVLSLAPFFPLPLPSSFGKSRSVMMITFLDIFLDRLPGKRFVVLLFTLISLFSLSYARIPASNACE